MAINIRETQLAFGRVAQSAIHTPNIQGDLFRWTKMNTSGVALEPVVEDDRDEIGKGTEFAQNSYLVNWNCNASFQKILSSQLAAWLFGFATNKSEVTTVGGVSTHVTQLLVDDTDDIELPVFTMLEKLRDGSFIQAVGNCINRFAINIGSGPGRKAAMVDFDVVGCGKFTDPTTLTIPTTLLAEDLLPASSVTATINGVDYVTAKTLQSLNFEFNNNVRLDEGFYPGSGFQTTGDSTSGAIRGRMEHADRNVNFKFSARLVGSATELAKVIAQTEGTASIVLTGGTISGADKHKLQISFPKVRFKTRELTDANGLVITNVDIIPIYDTVNGLFTATVVTDADMALVANET